MNKATELITDAIELLFSTGKYLEKDFVIIRLRKAIILINKKEKTQLDLDIYYDFVDKFNEITGKNIRKLPNASARGKLNARLKEGFTIDEILAALRFCNSLAYFKEAGRQYLTPEYITRQDSLVKYLDRIDVKPKSKTTSPYENMK